MNKYRWEQIGAAGGILYILLGYGYLLLVQLPGPQPALIGASAATITEFFNTRNSTLFHVGIYFSVLLIVPFTWYLGSLWAALRREEEEPRFLSTVVLLAGLTTTIIYAVPHLALAELRVDDGLDPNVAQLVYDLANQGLFNVAILFGGFLLAVGVAVIRTRALPLWIGWAAVVIAAGLFGTRAAPMESLAIVVPSLLYYIWLIVTSVMLIRRAGKAAQAAQ